MAPSSNVPVIVLTVPQNPVEVDPANGIHGVLAMPFSGFDLMNRISGVRKDFDATSSSESTRVFSIFAPKGGVGKTTIAFNLAVAMGQTGQRTVLIDGSVQFGDLRSLLKVPHDAPSILDLPTDRIAELDLSDVLWRDPSGIDILLAPPRIEMAEMITARDLDKILSLLRRVYTSVVIDMSAQINDINLAFLDASDTIVEIVTYDSTTIHNTIAMADTFRSIGYPASKVRYLVNRADSPGGISPDDLQRALGRVPEHQRRVRRPAGRPFEQRGRAVRARRPERHRQPGHQPGRQRAHGRGAPCRSAPGVIRLSVSDPRPIGVFDSGVGGLTVLREVIRRSPNESTIYLGDNARAPYGVRSDEEVLAFSTESLDALVERDVKALVVACNTSTAVGIAAYRRRYDLPVLGVIRPGASAAALATRNRRVGVIATPATIRSHAYFNAIKDENPAVEVYEHATPDLVPMVEAGDLSGPTAEATVAASLAALLGERDADGESIFPRPPGATIDTLLLGCTHYPLLRPIIAAIAGEHVAIVDSATATASALAELLSVNGLEVADGVGGVGRAARPSPADHRRPGPLRGRWRGDCSAPTSRTSSRSSSGCSRDDPPRAPTVVARRPRVAGRDPHRVGPWRRRDRRGPAHGADGAGRASSTGRRSSASRSGAWRARAAR